MPSTVLDARAASALPISPPKTTLSLTLNISWVSDKLLDELVRTELMEKGKKRGLNGKQNKTKKLVLQDKREGPWIN